MSTHTEHWKKSPEDHDFPNAEAYLSLLADPQEAKRLVAALKVAKGETRKAKDLFRSSRLALLPETDVHVASDLKKVRQGQLLSPVLLVRGDLAKDLPLTVADGYHRICASYHLDDDADVECRIISR